MPGGRSQSPSTRGRSPSTRGRSPSARGQSSRRRSYSRSPTYSDYSDSFYSDYSDGRDSRRKRSPARNTKSNASTVYRNNTKTKKKPMGKKGPGGRNTKGGGGTTSPRNMEYVTKRMLSARRIKINELKNEIEDLTKHLTILQTENRTLKREQHLREKALDKYELQENDMANILQKHNSEVRVLKESLKKNKDRNHRLDNNLKTTEEELERTKKLLKKMKGLVEDKELGERDELARKLSKAESLLDEKDKRVRDLERHTENLQKNHKHEMGIERARHKDTNKQLRELQDKYDQIQIQLREKEKEIEVKNIYANRMLKPPHHINSSASSSPAPMRAIRERKNSEPSMTPREKAKMFEQQRRDEQRKKKELRRRGHYRSQHNTGTPSSMRSPTASNMSLSLESVTERSNSVFLTEPNPTDDISNSKEDQEKDRREAEIRKRREQEEREERERLEELERERRERESEKERQEREDREWRERKERERRERDEREKREREDEERRRKREEEEEERKWKEERERRKKEADEMFNKQKREKEDRERREREERERIERELREREEIEGRAAEERDRLERDKEEQDRRRQKELLLSKMKAIDDGSNKAQQDSDLFSLSKGKTVTKDKGDSIFGSSHHSKKDYQFSKPIENMHSGKPAYEPDKKKKTLSLFDSDGDSDGGYNPSFGTSRRGNKKHTAKNSFFDDSPVASASKSRTTNTTAKKGDLMADLFGNSAKSKNQSTNNHSTKDLEFTFNSSPKKTHTSNAGRRDGASAQIYGGGSAFVDDDDDYGSKGNSLLPRRMKQPTTTIHNKPTINAVDDFEDEIEEVIL